MAPYQVPIQGTAPHNRGSDGRLIDDSRCLCLSKPPDRQNLASKPLPLIGPRKEIITEYIFFLYFLYTISSSKI